MTETAGRSDMATGLGLLLGFAVLLAAIATAGTAYLAEVGDHSDSMQLLSGIALSVAILAGGIAVVAIHAFE